MLREVEIFTVRIKIKMKGLQKNTKMKIKVWIGEKAWSLRMKGKNL